MDTISATSFLILFGTFEFFLILIILFPLMRTVRHLMSADIAAGFAYLFALVATLLVWPQVVTAFLYGENAFLAETSSYPLITTYYAWYATWADILTLPVFLFAAAIIAAHVVVPLIMYGGGAQATGNNEVSGTEA